MFTYSGTHSTLVIIIIIIIITSVVGFSKKEDQNNEDRTKLGNRMLEKNDVNAILSRKNIKILRGFWKCMTEHRILGLMLDKTFRNS